MIEHTDQDGNIVQDMLITYSEEERQESLINKENSAHIFTPKFIPVYPELLEFLTPTECLVFGFIDFYISNSSNRFYFTNKQLATMLNCSESIIKKSIKKLKDLEMVDTSRKMRAGGGQIRFIRPRVKSTLSKGKKYPFSTIKNKIKPCGEKSPPVKKNKSSNAKEPQKHIRIVEMFGLMKQIRFDTEEKYKHFLKRNLRPASEMAKAYDLRDVAIALIYCSKSFVELEWGIEAVSKNIHKTIDVEITKESELTVNKLIQKSLTQNLCKTEK